MTIHFARRVCVLACCMRLAVARCRVYGITFVRWTRFFHIVWQAWSGSAARWAGVLRLRLYPMQAFLLEPRCSACVSVVSCPLPFPTPAPLFVVMGLFRRAAATKKQVTPVKKKTCGRNSAGVAKLQKKTLDRIVELLSEHPEQAPLVLLALENGDYETTPVDDTQFDPKMSKLSQVPKYWLAGLMYQWQHKLSKATLEGLDAAEPETIRRLIEFATGVDVKSWRLPRSALTKAVLSKTLTARYSAYGGRLNDKWLKAAISGTTIDWQSHGVYRWSAKPEAPLKAVALESVNWTLVELPTDCSFSTQAGILENWSDVRASLRAGWRPSADSSLFKDTKYVSSSHPKVFEHECDNFARSLAAAVDAASSSSSCAAAGGAATGARGAAITEENMTIGQTRKKAKKPGFSPATASLVIAP